MQRKLLWLIQGQRASGRKLRGIFTWTHEGDDRGEGRHSSLTGSCGVLDWNQSLILPVAPGRSRFKCSQTKTKKKCLRYCRGDGWQLRVNRKCAWSGNPAHLIAWTVGHYGQVKLACGAASLCLFFQITNLWRIYRLVSSMGPCRWVCMYESRILFCRVSASAGHWTDASWFLSSSCRGFCGQIRNKDKCLYTNILQGFNTQSMHEVAWEHPRSATTEMWLDWICICGTPWPSTPGLTNLPGQQQIISHDIKGLCRRIRPLRAAFGSVCRLIPVGVQSEESHNPIIVQTVWLLCLRACVEPCS